MQYMAIGDVMIVAVPKFSDEIAPCFEAAGIFIVALVEQGGISKAVKKCEGCEGFARVRLLNENKVDVLICNGIKSFYKDILTNSGIDVIDNITLPVQRALDDYKDGKLKVVSKKSEINGIRLSIPLEDLKCWTKDLFGANGYKISPGNERIPFPIDLVAEITCPVCGKPIRIAICCGAHIYRADRELLEFHRASISDYQAQVYVHPLIPGLDKLCEEFGIELIDPLADTFESPKTPKRPIPILKKPVSGHEKAWE
jgi:predicted Fe-Mo cluster-binding NifX family protein